MKKLVVISFFLISLSVLANDKYLEAMQKNIDAVYNGATADDLLAAVNALNRIGEAERTKWEPFYYASFGYIMLATREGDGAKKDNYLELAKTALDKATILQPNSSELVALEGFVLMIRVTVDPQTRGPKYSMLAMQAFGKALALDPNNPRAMALMAQMQFGTAQFFKQAPTEACETNTKALQLFNIAVPSNPLAPAWGKGMAESLNVNCK